MLSKKFHSYIFFKRRESECVPAAASLVVMAGPLALYVNCPTYSAEAELIFANYKFGLFLIWCRSNSDDHRDK